MHADYIVAQSEVRKLAGQVLAFKTELVDVNKKVDSLPALHDLVSTLTRDMQSLLSIVATSGSPSRTRKRPAMYAASADANTDADAKTGMLPQVKGRSDSEMPLPPAPIATPEPTISQLPRIFNLNAHDSHDAATIAEQAAAYAQFRVPQVRMSYSKSGEPGVKSTHKMGKKKEPETIMDYTVHVLFKDIRLHALSVGTGSNSYAADVTSSHMLRLRKVYNLAKRLSAESDPELYRFFFIDQRRPPAKPVEAYIKWSHKVSTCAAKLSVLVFDQLATDTKACPDTSNKKGHVAFMAVNAHTMTLSNATRPIELFVTPKYNFKVAFYDSLKK